jgi:hypothetical protein
VKLNDTLDVISYQADPTSLSFILNSTKSDALAATEGKDLELKAGTSTVGIWKGWTVTGAVDYVSKSSDGSPVTYTRLTAARQLSPDMASAIAQLESNMQLVRDDVNVVKADVETAKASTADVQIQMDALLGMDEPESDVAEPDTAV